MARQARQFSSTGLYHIVFRGMNKHDIFEEKADYRKMIEIIEKLKEEMEFSIYVYCLMTNHVHILLKEKKTGDITTIMKRLLTKYARWFNIKYQRSGALIANRYKSEPIEVDEYFLSVVRYIHQNPLKAGMVDKLQNYEWSSYNEYIKNNGISDKNFVLEMVSLKNFIEFHDVIESEIFTVSDKVKKTDETIRREIIKQIKMEPIQVGTLPKTERNAIISLLKKSYSVRQIERITGISRGVIYNVVKKCTSP